MQEKYKINTEFLRNVDNATNILNEYRDTKKEIKSIINEFYSIIKPRIED
ncbi:UNVERIFIED_CONTAM: hypothetical protein O8I53_06345 [Campylobacter lari]